MCTYRTERISIAGSGKAGSGWFPVTHASIYVDHPVAAPAAHTLNIDFLNPALGPAARVAVELTATAARELVGAIGAALAAAPAQLLDVEPDQQPARGEPEPVGLFRGEHRRDG